MRKDVLQHKNKKQLILYCIANVRAIAVYLYILVYLYDIC